MIGSALVDQATTPSIMIIACKHALSTLPSSQGRLPMRYNSSSQNLKWYMTTHIEDGRLWKK